MNIVLALVIGAAFGVVLDRIGATNPTWIGRMLALNNILQLPFFIFPSSL